MVGVISTDFILKFYVNGLLNDPSILRNTGHVNFNYKSHDNVRFVKITSYTAVGEQLAAKCYVDEVFSHSVHQSSLLSLDPKEDQKPDQQDSILQNPTLTPPKNDNRNFYQNLH